MQKKNHFTTYKSMKYRKLSLKYNVYFQKVICSQVKYNYFLYFTAKFLYFTTKGHNCEANITQQNVRFTYLLQ